MLQTKGDSAIAPVHVPPQSRAPKEQLPDLVVLPTHDLWATKALGQAA
jgi:hypothetical protein